MCYFEIELQHIITCVPQGWWNCFGLKKSCDGFFVGQNNRWFRCFPQYVCKLEECHVNCQKFFWVNGHLQLCRGEIFEPNATGAYVFRFDCIFWSGLSSIIRAYPALLKLASVIKTSCFPGMGCFSTSSQASLRAWLTESNVYFNSDVILIGASV